MGSEKSIEILKAAQGILKEAKATAVLSERANELIRKDMKKMSQKETEAKIEVPTNKVDNKDHEKVAADAFDIGEIGSSSKVSSGHQMNNFLDNLDI